jgi:arginine decarboxylase-like protein
VAPVIITGVGRARDTGEVVVVQNRRFILVRGAVARENASQDTRVRRVFTEWLTAMNSSDPGQLIAFIYKYGTERKPQAVSALYEHGAVELLRITKTDSLSLEFVMREQKTGSTEVGFFALEAGDTARLQSLRLLRVPPGKTPDDAALLEHLRSMRP